MTRIEFKPPKEYHAPEGKGDGDEFEELVKFKIKKDGSLCLVEIGEVPMPGYKDDEGEDKPPDSRGYVQNMMQMANPAASSE